MYTATEDSDLRYIRPKTSRPKVSIAWLRTIARSGEDHSLDSLVQVVQRRPRFLFNDERALLETILSRTF